MEEDEETLKIHAMWPATEAHEFCFEFVSKEEEIEKEKFSETKFIEWMNSNLDGDYALDLYPYEDGIGIAGRIISICSIVNVTEVARIRKYLEKFFAPEDIDVSFT